MALNTPWRGRRFIIKGLPFFIVILTVSIWRGITVWQRPEHLMEIARAHGYVSLIYGVPQANQDGTKLVYSQMDNKGIGIFLLDVASGHKELVHEKVSADDWFQNADVWPWSPRGKHFIFTHTNLFIVDGATGKVEDNLPVEGVNGVASLAWLNDTSFVYASRAGNLHLISQGKDGHWQQIEKNIKTGTDGLTAISEETICWRKGNYIWSFDLASNTATVLFHARTNRLEGFSYSSKSGQFLVNCIGDKASFLQQLVLDGQDLQSVKPVQQVTAAHQAQWLDGNKGTYAYITDNPDEPGSSCLDVATKEASPLTLFARGKVDAMTTSADGRKLFIVGAISNGPASSIWEYEAASGSLKDIVPGVAYPSPYALGMKSRDVEITWSPGRKFIYHIYEPMNLNPRAHKKYPLVIGDTLFKALDPAYENRVHGPYWAPMLANAGAYVVIVERPGSWGNEMGYWEEYVDWVRHKMLENPTIDPNQVFLYATSAETVHLCNLAQKEPQLWKGLILLSPSALPELEVLSKAKWPPKILVDQGELEGTNRVHQYQMEAMSRGVRVEYHTHENNAHILLGAKAMGERAVAMTQFVFGD